ncbi:nitrogenase vanadium-iron protein delta chain [Ruminiclostridium hungatei]|uniref:nitrogenase n=1 Tax=Ruminiclostridium hungatei TaxID=48256 RepID=A0A1V4SHW2_RUMHU|nr:Fe-only/vanadium nitrogenase subunit delta [Ruminiclostridium hungatei]OPX43394.1 nitrogenase vanadium-iron protein delta chain [Ruminiclostridium hungatei]
MADKVAELYKFFQQRYLWQFYSRAWDRDENINGILDKLPVIFSGGQPEVADTLKDRAFYAEARIVAMEVTERYPWVKDMDVSQLKSTIDAVKEKIIDVTITKSQNGELNIQNY